MKTNMQAKKFKTKHSKINIYKNSNTKTGNEDDKKRNLTKKDLKKKFQLKRDKHSKVKSEEAHKTSKKKFKTKFKQTTIVEQKSNDREPETVQELNREEKFANKEAKSSNVTKKHLKRKHETTSTETADKKIKLFQLKKKERKLIRQKQKKTDTFERNKQLKNMWEELRKDNCETDKKTELLQKTWKLIKGHIKELCFAHDTVRVLECVFGLANKSEKEMMFHEIKGSIIELAKSKYGKFLLIKVLRNGSKDQKHLIMTEMHSRVISLISHSEAAEVVEVAFNECASTSERIQLSQEFYGPMFKYFKDSNVSLKQLLEKEPDKKSAIIEHMKEAIIKCFQKSVVKHSFIHYILRELLVHADAQARTEVIESVRQVLAEMLHTKDGARATMYCIWHGTKKDRKVIVKSFKSHVFKIAQEEYGHLVLLSIFDSIDDTNLVKKVIISELLQHISELMQNLHGRKVLLYLISPRDTVHFCPDVIKILQEGDGNQTSVKDACLRQSELKEVIIEPLVKLIATDMPNMYKDNSFCLASFTILKHAKGYCTEAFESIAKLVAIPYSDDTKNTHIIESPGSSFMLKKLLIEEKKFQNDEHQECFSTMLIEIASSDAIKSWTECNRGCFLLVGLLETEIESVRRAVKAALHGYHTHLSKLKFFGASILLKKIKQ